MTHKEAEASKGRRVVGIDFDNTIVSYDSLLFRLAREMGLVGPEAAANKHTIRDLVRQGKNGEVYWQELQAMAYGPRMGEAAIVPGVSEFIHACLTQEIRICIVSHKTQFAARDTQGVDLREAALGWMRQNRFFDLDGLGLDAADVYFEPTRAAKVARIRELDCTHFIDDLEETFLEPGFPEGTVKVLFRPAGAPVPHGDWLAFADWGSIRECVLGAPEDARLRLIVATLLNADAPMIEPVPAGGNSEVFRVRDDRGRCCLGKRYKSKTADGRDRLDTEIRALELILGSGLMNVPHPVACDRENAVALYEYVEGTSARKGMIVHSDIDAAADFLIRLAAVGGGLPVEAAPPAAEACFSFEEALINIRGRIERLRDTPSAPLRDSDLTSFLDSDLIPMVEEAAEWGARELARYGLTLEARLPRAAWVLSPSDFGFHNAVRRNDGSLVFVDFEYFGWDDPAKMVSDFILHPAMDLSEEQKAHFVSQLCRGLPPQTLLAKRLPVAYPLFAAKWCLIMLNVYLPGRPIRPGSTLAPDARAREEKLAQARALLQRVRASYKEFPYSDRR